MRYKIFIIEDDKGIAEAIRQILADWDMDSRIVRDYHNVMKEYAAYEPHLVDRRAGNTKFNSIRKICLIICFFYDTLWAGISDTR